MYFFQMLIFNFVIYIMSTYSFWYNNKMQKLILLTNIVIYIYLEEMDPQADEIILQTGEFIDESMLEFAWGGKTPEPGFKFDINLANHMTIEQNQQWADKVYDRISR